MSDGDILQIDEVDDVTFSGRSSRRSAIGCGATCRSLR